MKKLTQNEELLFCNLKLEDIASRAKMYTAAGATSGI